LLAAETGCGKTLAYLTPIVQQILNYKEKSKFNNQFNSPLALIIVPGRELAVQIGVCSVNNIISKRTISIDSKRINVIFYRNLLIGLQTIYH